MPEPNVLYTVTAVVVVGLAAWVAFTLKTAKEPWARPAAVGPAEEVAPPAAEVVEAKVEEKAEEKVDETAEEKADDKPADEDKA